MGGGTKSKEAAESGTMSVPFWVIDSQEFTMSVAGRMVEGWSGCAKSGGVEESVIGVWSMGGGVGDGEGGSEEISSLIQEEAGTSSWESPIGASPV